MVVGRSAAATVVAPAVPSCGGNATLQAAGLGSRLGGGVVAGRPGGGVPGRTSRPEWAQ